jgi:hypothetical protein
LSGAISHCRDRSQVLRSILVIGLRTGWWRRMLLVNVDKEFSKNVDVGALMRK